MSIIKLRAAISNGRTAMATYADMGLDAEADNARRAVRQARRQLKLITGARKAAMH